jgi:hypothetical protein
MDIGPNKAWLDEEKRARPGHSHGGVMCLGMFPVLDD